MITFQALLLLSMITFLLEIHETDSKDDVVYTIYIVLVNKIACTYM